LRGMAPGVGARPARSRRLSRQAGRPVGGAPGIGDGTVTEVTPGEIMVAQAALEIKDGERVFVGMRLPLIAFVVAKRTHAPSAVGLFELGIVRDEPAPELLYTMGDPANVRGASWCARTIDLMGLLQRGEVHAGFIGGAEIDVHGNLRSEEHTSELQSLRHLVCR